MARNFISLSLLLFNANLLSKNKEKNITVFICKDGNGKYFASIDGLCRTRSNFKSRESIIYYMNFWKTRANYKFDIKEV